LLGIRVRDIDILNSTKKDGFDNIVHSGSLSGTGTASAERIASRDILKSFDETCNFTIEFAFLVCTGKAEEILVEVYLGGLLLEVVAIVPERSCQSQVSGLSARIHQRGGVAFNHDG
jgi:hypothetical protein